MKRAERIAAMFGVSHGAADPGEDPWGVEQEAKKQQRDEKRAEQKKAKAKRARTAAHKIEKAGLGVLDVALLLDELTVDDAIKWISFMLTDGEGARYFNFDRMRLRRIGTERRRNSRMKDVRAWIDTAGIHLRWGDRGGLDLRGEGGVVTDPRTLRIAFMVRQTVETAA